MSHSAIAAAANAATTATAATGSKPFIDWASLGKVVGVSFVFGVAIVVLFAIGIVGVSWIRGETGTDADGVAPPAQSRPIGYAISGTCFAVCAGAVLYGLWLMIPQFHN
ncbi:hypothetical protein SAMN05892883_0681 [Jatrophihabitans sp. GAS493]|uniref:hypothetical protein n=1 Tax=Jatrophihabitans sp. GAS493 TaxID=1907575 RepID=UPI000BB8C655|nr:hypothetical protein [Jatrophihabitans sp. GAS493]SOD71091.1 hypothetical protein SAMN05892883_0681 [Jatrophihabitans sp. GAS493]